MAMTMKGLLKGLRYITQIFDEEKEAKMKIGYPTDVKHVAHIGSDCPSVMKPSWMNKYKAQEMENGSPGMKRDINQGSKFTPDGRTQTAGISSQDLQQPRTTKKTRSKTSTNALPLDSMAYSADSPSRRPIGHNGSYGPMGSSTHVNPSSRVRQHNSVPQ